MSLENNVTFITGYSYQVKSANSVPAYTHEVSIGGKDAVIRIIEQDFAKKAAISLNELYVPFSTTEDDILYSNLNENPRISDFVGPTLPGTRESNSGYFRAEVMGYDSRSGLNIGVCPTFDSEVAESSIEIFDKEDTENIRSMGLRVPFVFAGFGYDTQGFPTPCKYDELVAASGREFYHDEIDEAKETFRGDDNIGNLEAVIKAEARMGWDNRDFARKYRQRQDLWKVGPFDVRWDDGKSMWVAAPEVFQGYTIANIPAASGRYAPSPFQSGEMCVITGIYKDGKVEEPWSKLLIINRSVTTDIPSGTFLTVIRAGNGEYVPLHVDCVSDRSGAYGYREDT